MEQAIIYSFTEVFVSSVEFKDRTPYTCAIIEAEGRRFPALLEFAESVKIGARAVCKSVGEKGIRTYTVI
jgi:uncharacterized OB-fold protein